MCLCCPHVQRAGWPYVLIVFCLFVIFIHFSFWFSPAWVKPCFVLEQGTFTPQKVLVIPRKRWLRPNMTEKLFTGTLRINQPTNHFGFKSGIWLLIVPVPVYCFSITFSRCGSRSNSWIHCAERCLTDERLRNHLLSCTLNIALISKLLVKTF